MRIEKVTEFGAFCIGEWKEKCMYMHLLLDSRDRTNSMLMSQDITHIIVESRYKYSDVLKYLKLDRIPVYRISPLPSIWAIL
jgi:DNA polymerase IV